MASTPIDMTAVGFKGSVDAIQWAGLASRLGSVATVATDDDFALTLGLDRTITLSPGTLSADGIDATLAGSGSTQLDPVTSGTIRWDTVAVRNTWTDTDGNGTSQIVVVQGTSIPVLPTLNATPGDVVDVPLWMIPVLADGSYLTDAQKDLRPHAVKVFYAAAALGLPRRGVPEGALGYVISQAGHRTSYLFADGAWVEEATYVQPFVAASQWTVQLNDGVIEGRHVTWGVTLQRKSSAGTLAGTASGNIPNVMLGYVPAAFKPYLAVGGSARGSGPLLSVILDVVSPSGPAGACAVYLAALPPNVSIAPGDQISFTFSYILATP